MKICSEDGCENKFWARGFCGTHYRRWYRQNNPECLEKERQYSAIRYNSVLRCDDDYMGKARQRASKWYSEHKDDPDFKASSKARGAAWKKAHPENRQSWAARRRQRSDVGMTDQDRKDSVDWRKVLKNMPCYYCGDADAESYHVDHMTPLSKGGTEHFWNLCNSCSTCNLRKNAKTADEYIASRKEIKSND